MITLVKKYWAAMLAKLKPSLKNQRLIFQKPEKRVIVYHETPLTVELSQETLPEYELGDHVRLGFYGPYMDINGIDGDLYILETCEDNIYLARRLLN